MFLSLLTDGFLNPVGFREFLRGTLPLTLLIAAVLDLLLADPLGWPHPVVGIGKLSQKLERLLRRGKQSPRDEKRAGVLLVVILVPLMTLLAAALQRALYVLSPYTLLLLRAFFVYQLLALQGLARAGKKIAGAMRTTGLPGGRVELKHIVGRDTGQLSAADVIKATVESLAENFSDGVIAPLLFFLIADLPGMVFYKTINTLDSMVAYKNERYLNFGWAAAKLDDIANYIPARIAAMLLLLASGLLRFRLKNAWKIFRRDRYNHPSPNSAQTESVVAGALGLQLGGGSVYDGKYVPKPTIGDALEQPAISHIDKSRRLIYVAAALALLFGIGLYKMIF